MRYTPFMHRDAAGILSVDLLPEDLAKIQDVLHSFFSSLKYDRTTLQSGNERLTFHPEATFFEVRAALQRADDICDPATTTFLLFVSWSFLILGVAGLVLGIGEVHAFLVPSTILIGSSLIALALQRKQPASP